MDAQGPALPADVDQGGQLLRQLLRHDRELVHHDDQARQRVAARHAGQRVPVPLDVGLVCPVQDRLAPLQLRAQRDQRPLDQELVQVAEHPGGVRQRPERAERGAALVVDQHEVHRIRPVGHGERADQGLQQLALARSGGARHQQVRPLGQVQHERTVGPQAEERLSGPAARGPASLDLPRVRRLEAGGVEEPHRGRQRARGGAAADVDNRSQRPRGGLAHARRDGVGRDALVLVSGPQQRRDDRAVVVGQLDDGLAALGGQLGR